ncbi:hypothetical protein LZ198_17860 [Myxococcus sp. K15C18031901]|uniref:hypothetical protein n=1 Tax=Myxococcus dinghuensis TaxID=2906761 RepID=UPI0020A78459|nr:hypothetical protein [Myxococcus dinghuensis]MCP3100738.1 hypothetical protein [Myxococcus dinghuensis]
MAEAPATLDTGSPGAVLESLARTPATAALSAYTQASEASAGVLQAQRDEAQARLPVVPTPTGIPAQEHVPPEQARSMAATPATAPLQASAASTRMNAPLVGALVPEAPALPAPTPTVLAGSTGELRDAQSDGDRELARSAQGALDGVSQPGTGVPTRATERPSVDLSGEADPTQLESAYGASDQQTHAARLDAAQAIQGDFGENAIFPEPDPSMLRPRLTEAGATTATPEVSAAAPSIPSEARASIDAGASPPLQERVGAEQQRYAQEQSRYESDTEAAHAQAHEDIAELGDEARSTQTDAQSTARAAVGLARRDWDGEHARVEADFQGKAETARTEHHDRISTKTREGNSEADAHIAKAEQDTSAEQQRADAEAERKKREAKKKSSGFWGWARSKAKALIDGLKAAVNFVYDNLRKAVKAIFDAAKKLALAAIELARKAVVGLIQAYGAVLKGLVSIALAAFPDIRDRMLRRIDQAVETATRIVNTAAEVLKKGVAAVLDFLAETIDKALGLVQSIYNGILTVVGMLISGELQELLARFADLVAAAKTAPGQFETAAYEELLGGNLDQPLSPAELAAAGRMPPAVAASPEGTRPATPQATPDTGADAPLPGPPWTEANVGVDEVATGEPLPPPLLADLHRQTGGGDGTVVFGESTEAHRTLDAALGLPASGHAPAAQTQTEPGQETFPDDGLTPRERAAIKWEAMKKGLAAWWSANWPYVLAGGVIALAGFIIANILTGGALLAALPPIMSVMGSLFTGLMVMQLAGHVRDFLQKGWNGDIAGGGKSLAKGMAAGAIELISLLTFKAGGLVLKGARATARGAVKGAQALAEGVSKAARALRGGANYVLKGGKVLLGGVGRGITRGVESLRALGGRLLSRTRFKGFRILLQGRRFRLEGRINPWVLLVQGPLTEADVHTPGATRLSDKQLAELRKSTNPQDYLNKVHADDLAKAGTTPANARNPWPHAESLEDFADRMRAELNKAKGEYDRLRRTSPLSQAEASRLRQLEEEVLPKLSKDVHGLEKPDLLKPPRPDARDIPTHVTTANKLSVEVPRQQLDHILFAHTVENFDPVRRIGELAHEAPTHITSFFPERTLTNHRELFTLIEQALAGKGGRNIIPTGNNHLRITSLRNYRLEGWVGLKSGGGLKVNSLYVQGGQLTLTKAQIQAYATAIQNGSRTVADIRQEISVRFVRGF